MSKDQVEIIIRGPHNTGRTTLKALIRLALEENGFTRVFSMDTEPLPQNQKAPFSERFEATRQRTILIRVEETAQ